MGREVWRSSGRYVSLIVEAQARSMSPDELAQNVFTGILVGGYGRRLGGVEKSTLSHPQAETFLAYLVEEFSPLTNKVVLAARAEQVFVAKQHQVVVDDEPGQGPLSGLLGLLETATVPWCFLVACDMPRLRGEVLLRLCRDLNSGTQILVPRLDGILQPTCALYHRDLLPAFRSAYSEGIRSLTGLIARMDHDLIDIEGTLRECFTNINTEEDLLKL